MLKIINAACMLLLIIVFTGCNEDNENPGNSNSGDLGSENDNPVNLSSDNEITGFSFNSPDVTGIITIDNDITIVVPYNTNRAGLKASFTTTGAKVMVGDTVQISESTSNDFTNPVTYRVIADDGTSREYSVSVQLKIYAIRERGPGNGWICYENPSYVSDGWRYLEAAPADLGNARWGTYKHSVAGAGGQSIGSGKQNTSDIIAGDPKTNNAAHICANFTTTVNGVTYNDWFLPSLYELETMHESLKKYGVAGFSDINYQTSSEVDIEYAWIMYFKATGDFAGFKDDEAFKDEPYQVRPCRRF